MSRSRTPQVTRFRAPLREAGPPASPRALPRAATRRRLRGLIATGVAATALTLPAGHASATPALLGEQEVGAQVVPALDPVAVRPSRVVDVFPPTPGRPTPISDAMAAAAPGDQLLVHGGEYAEHLATRAGGHPDSPIWVTEAPGESVVLRGAPDDTAPLVRIQHPHWIVQGIEIDVAGAPVHAVRVESTHDVLIDRIDAHGGTSGAGVAFVNARLSAITNSTVHGFSRGDDDSHGVLVYGDSRGVLIRGNHGWGNSGDSVQCAPEGPTGRGEVHPRDVTIDFNRFGGVPGPGSTRPPDAENAVDIKTCTGVTIRGNKMMGYRAKGSSPQGAAIVAHYDADRILIEHNRIWDSSLGASLGSPENAGLGAVVFRRNLVFDLTEEGLAGGKAAGGVRIAPARVAEVYNNTFFAIPGEASPTADSYGIRVGQEAAVDRAVVVNNVVDGTGQAIRAAAVSGPAVSHNLVWRAAGSIPAGSLVEDPGWRPDPVNNDFYTEAEGGARDRGLWVGMPFCGAGPDLGFLETCHGDAPEPAPVDLGGVVGALSAAMPGEGSEGYRAPSSSDAAAFRMGLDAAARGSVGPARTALALVDYDVDVLQDTATGRTLLALRERARPDGTYRHGWGLYVLRQMPTSGLVVEVPHPRADLHSEDAGVTAFRTGDARALLVAGAHRRADADGSADVAHRADSAFHLAHLVLGGTADAVLQLHGFSSAGHPGYPDAVVSAGVAPPTGAAEAVAARLSGSGFTTCVFDTGAPCSDLGATTNVQAQASRAAGVPFVHVELSDGVRADPARRDLAAREAALALG